MLPVAFIEEIRAQLGDETDAFLRALDQPPALALRVNPLRPGAMEAASAFLGDPVPWARGGYYLREGTRPGLSLAHAGGAFYLQEASAMVSAAVLDARPGEKVLDLCAAPGGKSTQIAGAMGGEGLLVSNEPVPNRARILAENLERFGAVNAVAVCAYPDRLAERWPEFFDAILVDAPCSGEGMFRREPASRDEWNPAAPAGCAKRQREILDQAARMLRPGGRLVYSTCTFNRVENEGTIRDFLQRHPEFTPAEFELPGVGRSEGGMQRAWPHRLRGDGHFVAKLEKVGAPRGKQYEKERRRDKKTGRPKPTSRPSTLSEQSPEFLRALLEETICALPEALRDGKVIRQADYLHVLPKGAPPLDGIKTVKPGLCILRVGRSHIQPMHALAMAAGAAPLRCVALDGPRAERYLRGETLEMEDDSPNGWLLVAHDRLPLGWGKRVGGALKAE